MKNKAVITIICSLILMSCGGKTENNNNTVNEENKEAVEVQVENKIKTIHLSEAEFLKKVVDYKTNPDEWKYLGDKPALIDFYATWCGPCKVIAPILEELAKEYDGEIYIYKIDTDEEPELATAFGISSIPSLLFIPMNEKPQMIQGALPKDELKSKIEKVLLKK